MRVRDRVCLIAGIGPGTVMECARRFSLGGYKVAMLARDTERLGTRAFVCDVADLDLLMGTTERVASDLGLPSVVIHNAVSGTLKGGGESQIS